MDWQLAIDRNRAGLLRIVAALFALAGLSETAIAGPGPANATLPRHLRNRVYRILRPAESAVRRLIVMTARGMEGASAPLSPGGRESLFPHLRGRSTSKCLKKAREGVRNGRQSRLPSIPLFDPLKSFHAGKKYSKSFPRISFIGVTEPCPLPPVPSPDDPVNAERLGRRLQALKRALGDLDGQARRYARWKIRREQNRAKRNSVLRPGWPPGYHKRKLHEVDDVLADCHALALLALNPPEP